MAIDLSFLLKVMCSSYIDSASDWRIAIQHDGNSIIPIKALVQCHQFFMLCSPINMWNYHKILNYHFSLNSNSHFHGHCEIKEWLLSCKHPPSHKEVLSWRIHGTPSLQTHEDQSHWEARILSQYPLNKIKLPIPCTFFWY